MSNIRAAKTIALTALAVVAISQAAQAQSLLIDFGASNSCRRGSQVGADDTYMTLSKPDPKVFTLAASMVRTASAHCFVVEDANAGVEAGVAAGMKVLAVDSTSDHPLATLRAKDLSEISVDKLLQATP